MTYTSRSIDDTKAAAFEFLKSLEPRAEEATVIALMGDLGAGKTTFSQSLGECLGVRGPIQSPTYLIEKIYELQRAPWQHMVHIDAYRLEDESELTALGWNTITKRPENLIIVEWADKIRNILPESAIHIVITHVDETTREIQIGTEAGTA